MGKQEFIESLKSALNGRVSPSLLMENLKYYEDYINMEIRKGRSESEIMVSLGDPRLIAKTIISTNGGGTEDVPDDAPFRDAGYQGYEQGSSTNQNGYGGFDHGQNARKAMRIPGWVWLVVVILIIVLIFSAIFSVLSFLMPIVLPVLLIMFLIKLFRDWLK